MALSPDDILGGVAALTDQQKQQMVEALFPPAKITRLNLELAAVQARFDAAVQNAQNILTDQQRRLEQADGSHATPAYSDLTTILNAG